MGAEQTITAEDLAREVVRIADENPDYVYVSPYATDGDDGNCVYVERDEAGEPVKGSCIFGQALWNLGIVVPRDLEGKGVSRVLQHHSFPVTEPASLSLEWALSDAQASQDGIIVPKLPWGQAVESIREALAT